MRLNHVEPVPTTAPPPTAPSAACTGRECARSAGFALGGCTGTEGQNQPTTHSAPLQTPSRQQQLPAEGAVRQMTVRPRGALLGSCFDEQVPAWDSFIALDANDTTSSKCPKHHKHFQVPTLPTLRTLPAFPTTFSRQQASRSWRLPSAKCPCKSLRKQSKISMVLLIDQ